MAELPKIVRQRLQAERAAGAAHPDANLLSAFVERSLSEGERTLVLEHLARCAECREIVMLALPQEAEVELGMAGVRAAAGPLQRPPISRWWRASLLRWGALAAGVVIVASAVLVPKLGEREMAPSYSAREQPTSKVAELPLGKEVSEKEEAKAGEPERERAPQAAARKSRPAENKAAVARDARKDLPRSEDVRLAAAPPAPEKRSMADAVIAEATPEPAARPQSRQEQVTVANEDRAAPTPPAAQMLGRAGSLGKESAPEHGATKKVPGAMPASTTHAVRNFSGGVRWSISANGEVQRSLDSGRTWEVVPIAQGAQFRAVLALGREVWAGGAGGALYHSSDGGEHWSRIAVHMDGIRLSGDIVRIEFSDLARGIVATSSSETWATEDAGRTWQRR
ncbi:MAG TPA: YCF48-related protein [Terriglobales bacterium]|jgi:hypothetical protein|nr:YCF48-related protein [Terriglobales bacterium]